ncbi:MAG TPA: mismatch-specific DNA-glycosylase, partial [Firmicutes bacterium]|nr:mismatch-specific DNA-glycosylase [Bacillota bacterium]
MNRLPDYLRKKMKILFIGYNPGLRSAELGHHYAGRSNSFFPFLYQSGLISEPLTYEDDALLLPVYGYGLTNLVSRPSLGIKDLTKEDYREGAALLLSKLLL